MSDNGVIGAGMPAPNFKLASSTGRPVELASFIGKRPVVLYFYPRADTPGCTKETCGFRDALPEFEQADITVLGISPDPIEDVERFARKFDVTFPLLADSDHAVAEKYGVWQEKSNYGRTYMGVVRTTFLIGKDGRVKKVFNKVKVDGHDGQVLECMREELVERAT